MNFEVLVQQQKSFFENQNTASIPYRLEQLKKLKDLIIKHEEDLYEAVYKDFKKSKFDTYTTEISFVIHEINFYLKNLKKLCKSKRVKTNLINQVAKSCILPEPLGNILVIGAWNYPIQLSILPSIAALAAGNTVILKPSELASHTASALAGIINSHFDEGYFKVIVGGIEETTELLKNRFDKIFFTGSTSVGKLIYKAAAENLSPVVLELGGKSPAIVTKNADIKVAAKRIVWGKFLNAGQTCVAPDYVLVDDQVKNEFLKVLKEYLILFDYSKISEHYPQIINTKNFHRLTSYIDGDKIFFGGQYDENNRYFSPTVLYPSTWTDKAMQDEIFGPILPVIPYDDLDSVLKKIRSLEKPLSAYIFTKNKDEKKRFLNTISCGGTCINDVVMHITNPHLPFGGVENSGFGNYHGIHGFQTFSHYKAVLEKSSFPEPNWKYPPYNEKKLKWIKRIQ